jgi:multidrug efflux pump subunit AcrA (membrane-fusion protein)
MHRRYWWIATSGLAATAALLAIVLHRGPAPPPPLPKPAVALATVRAGTFTVKLDESGYVGAPAGTTTQVSFADPGILSQLYVRVGQHVARGQPLAQLDTRALALEAARAQAQAEAAAAAYAGGSVPQAALDAARAQVAADQAGLARAQRLYAAGVDALKDVQLARAQLAAARANLRSASSQPSAAGAQVRADRMRAAEAELTLRRATLYAPAGGVVTAILRRPGEAVDPSTPVLSIGPPQNEITLNVPGNDASRIATGDPVALRFTDTNRSARGVVSAIVPAVDPATQTATVVVACALRGIVSGSAVRARITVAHVRGLLLPESAIVEDPQTGAALVFVARRQPDGSIRFAQRTVRIRYESARTADLWSGVRPGERVAAQGAFELLAP